MEVPGSLHARVRWLSVAAAVAFAALSARAAHLVATGRPPAARHAAATRRVPERGRILAAGAEVLADNVTAHEVDVAPAELLRAPWSIDRLAALLGYNDAVTLHEIVARAARSGTRVLRLRAYVDVETARRIRVERRELPGVWVTDVPRRRYPHGALTAFPLGFMADVDAPELDDTLGYRTGDRVGRAGVERSWELTLRGVSSHAPEHRGMTLVTSLQLGLQRAALAALAGDQGAVVALDPRDGRVLAYVSQPAINPEAFEHGDAAEYSSPRVFPTRPLLDRASEVAEPPGHAFTPFVALAALAHGIPLPGGSTSIEDALASDPAERIGALARGASWYTLVPTLRAFGFGRLTGVDLRGENVGTLSQPGVQSDGVRATPLQLATAYAALANGGTVYQPRIVEYLLGPDGAPTTRMQPVVSGRVDLPDGARDRTLRALRHTFRERGERTSTPDIAAIEAVSTSQDLPPPSPYSPPADAPTHQWFVGLTPSEAPRVVVVAFVEHTAPRGTATRAGLAVVRAWQQLHASQEGTRP